MEISEGSQIARARSYTFIDVPDSLRTDARQADPLFVEKEGRFVRKILSAINAQIVALLSSLTL